MFKETIIKEKMILVKILEFIFYTHDSSKVIKNAERYGE